MSETLWTPSNARIEKSPLREYLNWLQTREGRLFTDHDALWAWSVEDLDRFWLSIVEFYRVDFRRVDCTQAWTQVRTADPMPYTRWFTGARLNWAQHLLRNGNRRRHRAGLRPGGRPAGAGDHVR